MNPFKGDGPMSPEDQAYLQEMQKAKERQMAAQERRLAVQEKMEAAQGQAVYVDPLDRDRMRASDEHRRRVRAANGVPQPAPVPSPSLAPADLSSPGSSLLSILRAEPFVENGVSLPQSKEQYAPDWPSLKQLIAKNDGIWVVRRYEFLALVPNLLGFFGKDGWEMPGDAKQEEFEVIVKNGRVFRTDPE